MTLGLSVNDIERFVKVVIRGYLGAAPEAVQEALRNTGWLDGDDLDAVYGSALVIAREHLEALE